MNKERFSPEMESTLDGSQREPSVAGFDYQRAMQIIESCKGTLTDEPIADNNGRLVFPGDSNFSRVRSKVIADLINQNMANPKDRDY